jgi:glycerophosphoryl diester phosphodiesterase
MSDLSGNTIECFTRGITQREKFDSWRYSECDVRETKDHRLVVFHDWDISVLQNTAENKAALGEDVRDQPICRLTLSQIQGLRLVCGSRIPTLEQVLEQADLLKIKKPLLLEFKHLHSDEAREELLKLALKFRDERNIEIHFLSFIRNVEICFPDSSHWMKKFAENRFRVYQVYRPKTANYDMCRWWNE